MEVIWRRPGARRPGARRPITRSRRESYDYFLEFCVREVIIRSRFGVTSRRSLLYFFFFLDAVNFLPLLGWWWVSTFARTLFTAFANRLLFIALNQLMTDEAVGTFTRRFLHVKQPNLIKSASLSGQVEVI